ncbi:glycosyltransferase family 2 protein [Fontivita pretiosa]|uniref:glycosyltransferase family 2 protein n=1 Tax=Fontivita pretiosa TaxID=2989684 RepID=UPI003D1691B9
MNPQVSIIIDNCNYGRFLPQAIDSALNQTLNDVEVIVVDDGSCDDSRQIIASYASRIHAILKDNGGQASALNAGFQASRGRAVIFLDADDILAPTAAEAASCHLHRTGAAKVHWPMRVIDASGMPTGALHPSGSLADGEFADVLVREGPWMADNPPTSGNAWSRATLDALMPIPPLEYRIAADAYLLTLAPMLGSIRSIDHPLSCYRLHGGNYFWDCPFETMLDRGVQIYRQQCRTASQYLSARGIRHDPQKWLRHSWFDRLKHAVEQISAMVPRGSAMILIDQDQWGTPQVLRGIRRIPFVQHNGQYWGMPDSDDAAIAELDRLRAGGADFVVIGWPAMWCLAEYPEFAQHLHRRASVLCRTEDVVIYRLKINP